MFFFSTFLSRTKLRAFNRFILCRQNRKPYEWCVFRLLSVYIAKAGRMTWIASKYSCKISTARNCNAKISRILWNVQCDVVGKKILGKICWHCASQQADRHCHANDILMSESFCCLFPLLVSWSRQPESGRYCACRTKPCAFRFPFESKLKTCTIFIRFFSRSESNQNKLV